MAKGERPVTQRGFAPPHAPMGGTGEMRISRDVSTQPIPGRNRWPHSHWMASCRASAIGLPESPDATILAGRPDGPQANKTEWNAAAAAQLRCRAGKEEY